MALNYVSLPLYPDSFYNYSVTLEGNSYIPEFTYSERMGLYTFSLYDAERNPLITGEALVPSYPMFREYALPDLSGWFWMEEISTIISEPYKTYPDKIDQYYLFYYVWETED